MSAKVAPHAGAWIETLNGQPMITMKPKVAPHAGAWIETRLWKAHYGHMLVAPHAGAWIETEQ